MNEIQKELPDPTLTIFANFRIDDAERLQRMKDSFLSFKDIGAVKWVINVRGKYKMDVLCFLYGHLQERLFAHLIESDRGWFADTREMLPEIDTYFVLFWIEDHISITDVNNYRGILRDMAVSGTQSMRYSWWRNGKLVDLYAGIEKKSYQHIEAFDFGLKENEIMQRRSLAGAYILDVVSIYHIDLFRKMILADDPNPPRWPKETPFDFEKNGSDVHWLPLKLAIPKYELFASIDADFGIFGSCLQSRGLYPCRELRPKSELEIKVDALKSFAITQLKAGVSPEDLQKELELKGLGVDAAKYIVEQCIQFNP